jgi:glycosyltransferase involved in cell wall biosynthesis
MTVGLPIACSRRSSLPETLQSAGVYFDPEDEESIASALEQLVHDASLRKKVSRNAQELAKAYSWQKCAAETWRFLHTVYAQSKQVKQS